MTTLVASILAHALLGVALAALIWGVGAALVGALREPLRGVDLLFAYPAGLLTASIVAFAFLLRPWLGAVAAILAVLPIALRRRVLGLLPLRNVLWATPAVLGLPFAMGLLLHGPTDEVPSSAQGDYVFWATRAVSAADSIMPFRDHLVADRGAVYVEGASTFLGGALTHVPGFDVFLFQTTALPALMLASISVGIGLLAESRERGRPIRELTLLAVLGIASIAYPTWLPESAPVTLALPLTFALFALWRERYTLVFFASAFVCVALTLYLTKGFVGLALLVVAAAVLYRDHRVTVVQSLRPLRLAAGLATAGGLAIALWSLGVLSGPTAVLPEPRLEFVPVDTARGLWGQRHGLDTQRAAPALTVVGQVTLAVVLLRARLFTIFAILAVGVLGSWLVRNYGFDLVVGAAVLLAVLVFWTRPLPPGTWRPLAAASVVLALAAWFRDISGVRAAFVFVVLLGFAFLASFSAEERNGRSYALAAAVVAPSLLLTLAGHSFLAAAVLAATSLLSLLGRRATLAAAAAASVLAVVSTAVAVGDDDFRLSNQPVTLTPEHHDVWHRVRDVVPRDALVFTSQTGPVVDGEHGWNYYPGVAGRQLYIAGWYDGPLLVEPEERERRFDVNRQVLAGELRPAASPEFAEYRSFFAVVRTDLPVPERFRLLHRNDRFALYRIP